MYDTKKDTVTQLTEAADTFRGAAIDVNLVRDAIIKNDHVMVNCIYRYHETVAHRMTGFRGMISFYLCDIIREWRSEHNK